MSLDLDIAKMGELMAKGTFDDFMEAKNVYEFGAFAWPYAEVQIDGGAPAEVQKGTAVTGYTMMNDPVRGYVLEHVKPRQGKLRIEYEVDSTSDQAAASQCSVGGNPDPNFTNCKSTVSDRVNGMNGIIHTHESQSNQKCLFQVSQKKAPSVSKESKSLCITNTIKQSTTEIFEPFNV